MGGVRDAKRDKERKRGGNCVGVQEGKRVGRAGRYRLGTWKYMQPQSTKKKTKKTTTVFGNPQLMRYCKRLLNFASIREEDMKRTSLMARQLLVRNNDSVEQFDL